MLRQLKNNEAIDESTKAWIRRSILRRNLIIALLLVGGLVYAGISYYNYYTSYDLYDVMSYFIDWKVLDDRMAEVLDEDLYFEEYDWAPYEDMDQLSTYDRFHLYATQLIIDDLNARLSGMMPYYTYIESQTAVEKYEAYQSDLTTFYAEARGSDFYLGIYSFDNDHLNDILDYKDEINGAQRLIIDLRDNPGGYMIHAFEMIDLFLDKDLYVLKDMQYGPDDYEDVYYEVTLTDKVLTPKEILILTDAYTASAAEIVTYALNANLDNVTIVGEKTFGKAISTLTFDDYYGASFTILASHFHMYNRDGSTETYQEVGIKPEIETTWNMEDYESDISALLKKVNELTRP